MLGLGDRMGPPSSSPGQGRNRGQEGAPSLPLVSSCQVCRALNYSLRECRPAVGVRGRPILAVDLLWDLSQALPFCAARGCRGPFPPRVFPCLSIGHPHHLGNGLPGPPHRGPVGGARELRLW